jgi:hypothetical protein
MITPDYSYFGSLKHLTTLQDFPNVHDFNRGPGWYQTRSIVKGKVHYDCCLLVEVPKGSNDTQEYMLYVFQNQSVNDIRLNWLKMTMLETRESL